MKHSDYTVGWICPLPLERAAAIASLDEHHQSLSHESDHNNYALGRIGQHNVAIANLPAGKTGTVSAATVAAQLLKTFPAIRICLLVGIGGGAPSTKDDVRLGDVVVSSPSGTSGGVIQYDFGKTIETGQLIRTGSLDAPPAVLLNAVAALDANQFLGKSDIGEHLAKLASVSPKWAERAAHPGLEHDLLYKADYEHVTGQTPGICASCDKKHLEMRAFRKSAAPVIHYGIIASGNQVMRHGATRDRIAKDQGILCFEMEAAGLMGSFPCLVIRGICDYSDSHKNDIWQPYAAATAAAYAKELLNIMPRDGVASSSTASEIVHQAADFRRQLEFPGMNSRKRQIFDAYPHSFDWIWEEQQQERSFVHWLSSNQKLFWIHGKPGSGKSTLMKCVLNDDRTRQYLEDGNGESQKGEECMILDFFFDFRAKKELGNNLEGLIRSLLLQFVQKVPKSKMNIDISQELEPICDLQCTVSYPVLERSLRQVLTSFKTNTCIFLDGLDEYAGKYHDLITLILRLVSDNPEWSHSIKICLASRPEPLLLETLKYYPGFGVQEYNSRSINDYAKQRLQELLPHSTLGPNFQAIISRLTNLANGIFLWASLAVDDTIERYCSGMETQELLNALDYLPSGLEEMYSRMLDRVNREYRYEASVMMQLACYAMNPISLPAFITAVRIATKQTKDFDEQDLPKFERRVRAFSGGLLQVGRGVLEEDVKYLLRADVRLVHETAGAYLTQPGIIENFIGLSNNSVTRPHELWMFMCAKILQENFATGEHGSNVIIGPMNGLGLLTHYSWSFLLGHSQLFEEITGCSSMSTIDAAMEIFCPSEPSELAQAAKSILKLHSNQSRWNEVRILFERTKPTPLALAASAGLLLYCEDKLEHGADINANEGIALQAAITSGREKGITLFLRKGARCEPIHVNTALSSGYRVGIIKTLIDRLGCDRVQNGFLHNAVTGSVQWNSNIEDILSHLVGLGLDINSFGDGFNTPLHHVVRKADVDKMEESPRQLSERSFRFMRRLGADVNAIDSDGSTPMDYLFSRYLPFGKVDHLIKFGHLIDLRPERVQFLQSLVRQGWRPKTVAAHPIMQELLEGI